jgi:hypothetical protein
MSHWNVKPSTLVILGGLVSLMLLIAVLPDVDLPDTAFHRGTAPVVVHAQATSAPPVVIVATVPQIHYATPYARALSWAGPFSATPDPNFRPILLRSIRC